MDVEVTPGRYVVAVSGGVDSVSLLHRLTTMPDIKLTVAHFDHGIRDDSAEDRKLVQSLAQTYDLPFVYQRAELGARASEAAARQARYAFLEQVRAATGAAAIITAHHQDDVLETVLLNLLRGTGRAGLAPLGTTPARIRPLLGIPKSKTLSYARQHHLQWREDSTNRDETYRRNYIRRQIMPKMTDKQREDLLQIINDTRRLNRDIDRLCINLLHQQPAPRQLDRSWFIQLPHAVSKEILAVWLRLQSTREFDAKTLERLTIAAKTGRHGTVVDIMRGTRLRCTKKYLALEAQERYSTSK